VTQIALAATTEDKSDEDSVEVVEANIREVFKEKDQPRELRTNPFEKASS